MLTSLQTTQLQPKNSYKPNQLRSYQKIIFCSFCKFAGKKSRNQGIYTLVLGRNLSGETGNLFKVFIIYGGNRHSPRQVCHFEM